jgi:hypothetical protein
MTRVAPCTILGFQTKDSDSYVQVVQHPIAEGETLMLSPVRGR